MASHETVCILNCSDSDAQMKITIFFADRGPAEPYEVPARRTRHVRFNDLQDPAPIPRDTGYTRLIGSAVPIVCQHARLDSRQAALGLLNHRLQSGMRRDAFLKNQ